MKLQFLCAIALASATCASSALAGAAPEADSRPIAYAAELHPLNTKVTGLATTGEAKFSVSGDELAITIKGQKLPPDIMHLQHFHGFKDNREATCPTETADKNGDGIIDLIETETTSGTTMVPFHDDPVSMEIVRDTYPKASADGSYEYQKIVSLKDLENAFAKAFGDKELDLDRRVVFVHGVLSATKLPKSAASLGTIPAQVTLPIACGEIEPERRE